MSYLLALDAGTGSIRAVIFDLNGRQLAVGQAEWKHLSVDNVPGSMEFDLTTNWQLACQCIRQALDAARLSAADIQSVACCSMREGIVLYDRNGEAIWACANVDARASREVAELKEIHDYRFESEVYEVSGQTLALSAMPRQAVGQALDPFPAGPQQHHSAIQPQRTERRDNRRNAQSHDQQAVKSPGQRANRQREGDSRRQPVTVVQRHADGDGAQPNGRAYRHINIAGQHHQRRAQCQQAEDLRAGENHRQGLQAEIGWIERHQHNKERHDGKEGAQFAILQ